ncbi:MAG: hypothetical protein ACXVCP_16645 [Bdellovibrio sp.]
MAAVSVPAQENCKKIFIENTSTGSDIKGKAPAAKVITPLPHDPRFFQMHFIERGKNAEFISQEASSLFQSAKPNYTYIKTLSYRNGSHHLIKSSDEIYFTVPTQSFDRIWNNTGVRDQNILQYLNSIRELVLTGKPDPRLNSFFDRIKEERQQIYSGYGLTYIPRSADYTHEYGLGPIKDTAFQKVLTETIRETNQLFIQKYDTEIRLASDKVMEEASSEIGSKMRLQVLNEVLDFVFKLYREKRGWSESFLEGLRQKAIDQLDMTTTIIVREKNPDGSAGKILGTMSLNRAPYGKVEFLDQLSNEWKEMYGSFGGLTHWKMGVANEAPYSTSAPELWGTDIPLLSMEMYFNQGAILPRPTVIERAMPPSLHPGLKGSEHWFVDGRVHQSGQGPIKPSPTEAMYFSSGIIFEPKTFGIAKENDLRGSSYSEILLELFSAVFHSEKDLEFHTKAQHLYTYNDQKGVSLYQLMGFSVEKSIPPLNKDGVTWNVLSLNPQKFLMSLKDPEILRRRLPEQFVKEFIESINKKIENSQFK